MFTGNMAGEIHRITPDNKDNRNCCNSKYRMQCAFQAENCWSFSRKFSEDKKKFVDPKYWLFRPENQYCALPLKEAKLQIGEHVSAKVCKHCDDLNTAALVCQRKLGSVIHEMVSEQDKVDEKGQEEEPELSDQMKSFIKGTEHLDKYIKIEKELRNAKARVAHWKQIAWNTRSENTTKDTMIDALRTEITELQEELDDSRTFSFKEGPQKSASIPFHAFPQYCRV
jgi:hypothetical protein